MVFYNDVGNRLIDAFRKKHLMKNEVVAGIAHRRGSYLVGLKCEPLKGSNLWEFPGGKVETGESLQDATRREWLEELGVELASFGGVICVLENKNYRIHFCSIEIQDRPRAIEHLELSWKSPAELERLSMHRLDDEFVKKYLISSSAGFAG